MFPTCRTKLGRPKRRAKKWKAATPAGPADEEEEEEETNSDQRYSLWNGKQLARRKLAEKKKKKKNTLVPPCKCSRINIRDSLPTTGQRYLGEAKSNDDDEE